jgi:LmbE family N-acetylglucosaminyl deacetylase
VPLICPDTPRLEANPVIAFLQDDFKKPWPFTPDVVVDVDTVMDKKWEMLHAHKSQFYEWLPYIDGNARDVPATDEARRAWLEKHWGPRLEAVAHRHRDQLARRYGADHASDVEYAEAFELCEYGTRPSPEALRKLFP